MGHKKLCLDCRLCLNREFDNGKSEQKYPCPTCRKEMILLPHRFRPPSKSDKGKWKAVEYLIGEGFRYEHTIQAVPENLRDAKAFWLKVKEYNQYLKNLEIE